MRCKIFICSNVLDPSHYHLSWFAPKDLFAADSQNRITTTHTVAMIMHFALQLQKQHDKTELKKEPYHSPRAEDTFPGCPLDWVLWRCSRSQSVVPASWTVSRHHKLGKYLKIKTTHVSYGLNTKLRYGLPPRQEPLTFKVFQQFHVLLSLSLLPTNQLFDSRTSCFCSTTFFSRFSLEISLDSTRPPWSACSLHQKSQKTSQNFPKFHKFSLRKLQRYENENNI